MAQTLEEYEREKDKYRTTILKTRRGSHTIYATFPHHFCIQHNITPGKAYKVLFLLDETVPDPKLINKGKRISNVIPEKPKQPGALERLEAFRKKYPEK